MEAKLGVIIPCYNHAKYVGAAIESVLGQTRPPDRFLVIDDGSKDDSVAVIEKYRAQGVELIVQENAGAHETINRGIRELSRDCQWISILNSDDVYEPGRFEACLSEISKEPALSVVCTGLRMIDPEGEPLPEGEPRAKWLRAVWSAGGESGEDIAPPEWLGLANFLVTSSNIVARAEYLLANPFRPYRFNHDYFFLAGAALRGGLKAIPDVLLQYRVHPTNNINSAPAPLLREMLRMHVDLYAHFAKELREDEAARHRFYEFAAASWRSVSSFHAGLFQVLLAELASAKSEAEREALVESLTDEAFAELHDYPNKALVNEWDGRTPLQSGEGLNEKYQILREEKRALEGDRRVLRELTTLRRDLLRSKWVGLGQALGQDKRLSADEGKTPEEKLENQKTAIRDSFWLTLGASLGSKSAKALLEVAGRE